MGKTSKLLNPTVTLKEHLVLHGLFYKPRLGSRPEMTWLGRGPTEVGLGVALTGFCHAQHDRRASVAGTSCGGFSCTHCRGYFVLGEKSKHDTGALGAHLWPQGRCEVPRVPWTGDKTRFQCLPSWDPCSQRTLRYQTLRLGGAFMPGLGT